MEYFAVTVLTTSLGSELVADIFFDIGGQGVTIMDSQDVLQLYKEDIIWDYIDEDVLSVNEVVSVTGYTSGDSLATTLTRLNESLETLKANSDFLLGSLEVHTKKLQQEDWNSEWKKHYAPIELDRVVIVPNWYNYKTDKSVVRIEPGMAFGTGEHESTKMCLQFLENIDLHGKTVLDIGCGSGILGIAALVLGAKSCYFSDIDSTALDNMRENANINAVDSKMTVQQSSLMEGDMCPKGDILLANITADMLIILSKSVTQKLKNNSDIILSGIIKEREGEVLDSFLKEGLQLVSKLYQNDWVALHLSYGN